MKQFAKYVALIAILSSTFTTTLNTSMTRIANPLLQDEFALGYSELTWVVNSYQIVYAILLPVFGQIGDKFGRRKLLMAGLLVFGAGSLLCGLSWNYASLVAFRVLQGAGAAMVFPNGVALALGIFPEEHRGKVMGIWGMAVSLGSVTGPSIGGAVVNLWGWKAVFLVNVPLLVVALLAILFTIKSDSVSPKEFKFDLLGTAMLSVVLVSLVCGIQSGADNGWSTPGTLIWLAVFAVALPLFVRAEKTAAEPVIDMSLLTNKVFISGMYCGGMHLVALQGMQFLMPLFMGNVLGMDPLTIGVMMIPQAGIRMFISPLAGFLEDKFTCKFPITLGIIVRTIGLVGYAFMTPSVSTALLTVLLLVDGTGAALIWAPAMNSVLRASTQDKASSVTGVFNMLRFIMGVIGVVLVGLVLDAFSVEGFTANAPVPGYFQAYLMLAIFTGTGLLWIRYLVPKRQTSSVSAPSTAGGN